MKTLNPHMPSDHQGEARAPKSASRRARGVEGLINKVMTAAALLLGAALIYGMFSASGTPSYFH